MDIDEKLASVTNANYLLEKCIVQRFDGEYTRN